MEVICLPEGMHVKTMMTFQVLRESGPQWATVSTVNLQLTWTKMSTYV